MPSPTRREWLDYFNDWFFWFLVLLLVIIGSLVVLRADAQTQAPSVQFGSFPATNTFTTAVKVTPFQFYAGGTIYATFTNEAGSVSACFFDLFAGGNNLTIGNSVSVFPTGSFTGSFAVQAAFPLNAVAINTSPLGPFAAAYLTWSCTTYPTSGTVLVEFVPDFPQAFPRWAYSHITSNGSAQLRTSPAHLHTIVINQAGTGETITIGDVNSGTCTAVAAGILTGFTTGQIYIYDLQTANGLCIVTSGTTAGDYTVTYR